ncbi:uncharacterized protein LOC123550937 [Mercenaria mercenaria]|uniref:uncharacterized protein LOC123550937 n=1 Tax=Mercenaria mercenaria TaxID=6596 RepID=UPI00234E3759|nr:uncharacterized protein LOC123550937 [Mercenaria mercenaria]
MSLISKHKPIFNRLFCLKRLKINLIEKREISFAQRQCAEDKGKEAAANDDTSKETSETVKSDREDTDLVQTDTTETPKKLGFIGRMKASHDQTVKDASGVLIRPTTGDKVALLWSGKYQTREDIPEFVNCNQQIAADNTARVVIFMWMMVTATLYFISMIKCGQRRKRILYERFTAEQNRIWKEREEEQERQVLEKKSK